MKRWQQVGVLLLLVSLAAAQGSPGGTAEVKSLQVKHDSGNVTIEVQLTRGGVKPTVETATQPDRLVLILPGTVSDSRQKRIAVQYNGVRAVRVGLHNAEPPETHVVIDLDRGSLPYTVDAQGSTIRLHVQASLNAKTGVNPNPPAAAASASVLGSVFTRPPAMPPQPDGATAANHGNQPVPPPSLPPINFPNGQSGSSGSTTAAANKPSAAHPNYGSLQQGVVNPGMGTPGAGTVPPALNTGDSGFDQKAAASNAPAAPAAGSGTFANANATPATASAVMPNASSAPATNAATASADRAATAPTSAPTPASNSSADRATVAEANVAPSPTVPSQGAPVPESQPSSTHADSSGSTGQAQEIAAEGSPENAVSADTAGTGKTEPAKEAITPELAIRRANPDFRIAFRVKYVASGAAYLDGGRAAGLAEGMKLTVRDTPGGMVATPAKENSGAPAAPPAGAIVTAADNTHPADANGDPTMVAELEVVSVAESSAVTDIHDPKRDVKAGDLAYLSSAEQDALVQKSALSSTRKYPTVIAFTEGDTLDDEVRAEIPRPPMPSVNRARGRFGIDYIETVSHGTGGGTSSSLGTVARLDMTRIGGTYWTARGYWRGRLTSSSYSGTQTIQDLINRTYHLNMMYENPNSPWVAGFGRMYLPWATSLDTIDGGYFGRRVGHGATLGAFAGSTPDPTSYSYNPSQEIAGSFINFDGGSFDGFKYTSTSGAGVSMLHWNVQKPFVFFENGFFYKRTFSLYDAMQLDSPSGNQAVTAPGFGMGRNFLTARYMPIERLEFNAGYNYFRDIPTFNPTLIGTGLLDKFLFQGASAGVRVEVLKQIWLYTDIGRSNRTGDPTSSLNQLYGITFGRVPWIKMRVDGHYSTFNSSFGSGTYEAVSLSRNLSDSFHFDLLAGDQRFNSQYSSNNQSKFLTTNIDFNLGLHYFLQGGFTVSRGATQDYDQFMFTLGYRFDTKRFKAQ